MLITTKVLFALSLLIEQLFVVALHPSQTLYYQYIDYTFGDIFLARIDFQSGGEEAVLYLYRQTPLGWAPMGDDNGRLVLTPGQVFPELAEIPRLRYYDAETVIASSQMGNKFTQEMLFLPAVGR